MGVLISLRKKCTFWRPVLEYRLSSLLPWFFGSKRIEKQIVDIQDRSEKKKIEVRYCGIGPWFHLIFHLS
jgi:hypothetical protein